MGWWSNWLIDWLDLHWVRALTVPMHLGLMDGPFVPHNLILAEASPVPLPKFQMSPRPKILMSSMSKKGTQMYYSFFSKSPGKRIRSRFPLQGSHRERERRPSSRAPFSHLSMSLVEETTPGCPTEPPWREMPVPRWSGNSNFFFVHVVVNC